ncbi:hypothetical protein Hanom_Chr09g00794431 [Helianthus anomalus]
MKKRLKEIEEEARALREMQVGVEKEMGPVQAMKDLYLLDLEYGDWKAQLPADI